MPNYGLSTIVTLKKARLRKMVGEEYLLGS